MQKDNKVAFVGFRTKPEFKTYLEKTAKQNGCTISDVVNFFIEKAKESEEQT